MSADEILLIKTAALFHDKGFIQSDDDHEEKGIHVARTVLPEFGYSGEEIEQIAGMIRATAIPQNPETAAEKILADADLEYLGTDDFLKIGDTLFEEFKFRKPGLTRDEWNQIQISFMKAHKYHTAYCRQYRAPKKQLNLELLERQRK